MDVRDIARRLKSGIGVRPLDPWERAIAHSVFRDSLPYDRVFLTDWNRMGDAVTLASSRRGEPTAYLINWPAGYLTTRAPADQPATLIHELVHAWQGENGVAPNAFVFQSSLAQLISGVKDFATSGDWKGWNVHRGATYRFSIENVGRPWRSFNVEQQAAIVQSWFMDESDRIASVGTGRTRTTNYGSGVYGGGHSEHDLRFPYIRDVIRARNRRAEYRALPLGRGGDAEVKAMQDKLVSLGYLEARHADGTVGRSRSATLDALASFQKRNGLEPDRNFGGPNSLTRRKLAQSGVSLVRFR